MVDQAETIASAPILVDGEHPEYIYAHRLLNTSCGLHSIDTPLTAPDVAYEKDSGRKETSDNNDKQIKPNPNDAKLGEYPSGPRLVFIVLALGLCAFLVFLDLTIVATAIPRIISEFHDFSTMSRGIALSFS